MRKVLGLTPFLALLAGFIAAVLIASSSPVPPAPGPVTVTLSRCGMRELAKIAVHELALRCYPGRGPWGGAASGARVGGPVGGGMPSWRGTGSRTAATTKTSAKSMSDIKKLANKHRVPWPNPKARRASDMSMHVVYHMRARGKDGQWRTHKFGISKNGEARPKQQLKACREANGGRRCRFDILRKDVRGWEKARQVEAGYATKYKMRHGKCPPGMKRCL